MAAGSLAATNAMEGYLSKEDASFAAIIILTIMVVIAIERIRRR